MGTFPLRAATIIQVQRGTACEPINDVAGVEQVTKRAKGSGGGRIQSGGGLQVRPSGGDEGAGAVREAQDEVKCPMTAHPPEHRERLALQWVAKTDDGNRRRKTIEVGSVMPLRSTPSTGCGYGSSLRIGSTTEDCSAS
jgi:hypothetical protein